MSLATAWHNSLHCQGKHRPHHTMGDRPLHKRTKATTASGNGFFHISGRWLWGRRNEG